jgi:cytoskeletal protein CcmA (bactofilin family)
MLKRKERVQFESPDRLNRLVAGTKIVGDLITDSNLRIDGEIVGNVFSRSKVVIGETGCVFGNISCLEADIEGVIEGCVEIEGLLVLREKSKIIGDINTAKLHIEEGAIFLGTCQMTGHEAKKAQAHLVGSEENSEDNTFQ